MRAGSRTGPAHVLDDLHFVDDDQAVGDQLVELGYEALDRLFRVDDDDGDRQVVGQRQDPGGVDVVRGSVALDTPKDAGAREAGPVRPLDDLGGEWRMPMVIGLADEDGETLLMTLQPHRRPPLLGSLATQMPAHTAPNPAPRLARA